MRTQPADRLRRRGRLSRRAVAVRPGARQRRPALSAVGVVHAPAQPLRDHPPLLGPLRPRPHPAADGALRADRRARPVVAALRVHHPCRRARDLRGAAAHGAPRLLRDDLVLRCPGRSSARRARPHPGHGQHLRLRDLRPRRDARRARQLVQVPALRVVGARADDRRRAGPGTRPHRGAGRLADGPAAHLQRPGVRRRPGGTGGPAGRRKPGGHAARQRRRRATT